MTDSPTPTVASQGRSLALWAGVIGAPAVWGIQLQVGYAIAPWLCKSRMDWVAHVVTIVCALLALLGAYLSWRDYRAAGSGDADAPDGGPIARTRFLGMLGAAIGLLVSIVIIAQGIPSFFFDGCWT